MPFTIRPFAACLAAFAASRPDEKLARQKDGLHYDAKEAHAFTSLDEWSSDPPVTSLYLMKNPLGFSEKVLDDPKTFVDYGNFGNAVGTWNAKGEARWQASPGAWIIADVSLVQEQAGDYDDDEGGSGDYVDVVFALWKVEEGFAAGVWEPHDKDTLAKVMGLDAWPSDGWAEADVWYGE